MISVVIVNFRSAALAVDAIRSARSSTDSPLEVIVVDNSLDPVEAKALEPHADTLIVSSRNRGYGGAINDARRACRGDVLLMANADVSFANGALGALEQALSAGAAVAGPALYWDRDYTWILPPSEMPGAALRIDAMLAGRSPSWSRWWDRRRTRARLRFWALAENREVPAISGAIMAVRTSDFDAVGGFDERFELYFEEHDLLRRIRSRGGRIEYVPSSRCRHLYNQSAGAIPDRAAQLFAESEAKYFGKWYGAGIGALLRSLDRAALTVEPEPLSGAIDPDGRHVAIEASPLPTFATAAGHFPRGGPVMLPDEVWDAYRAPVLYVRVVDVPSGRPLANYVRYRS